MKNTALLFFLKLIAWLPLRVARYLGVLLGGALRLSNSRAYRVTQINLSLCYPQLSTQEVERLARERMAQLGQAFFETPKLWRQSPEWLRGKIVGCEGREYLQAALDNPRGTILLVPHQGNWEVLGLWVATLTTMTSLYEPPKMAELENWIKTSRQRSGATLVPTNVRGVAALLKALRRGETTAILPDQQPPPASGEFSPIFGVPAQTMTLVHNLIQKSGSQVLLGTALRVTGGWHLHFMPVAEAINSADQQTSLDALNQAVESIVTLAPSQYQWEYKRFRARPPGYPPVYPKGS
ncbi:MAG: lysophospholipid acyltransferase family protein [Porticoccaceae bacterium]